jgi:hypothetical protein
MHAEMEKKSQGVTNYFALLLEACPASLSHVCDKRGRARDYIQPILEFFLIIRVLVEDMMPHLDKTG